MWCKINQDCSYGSVPTSASLSPLQYCQLSPKSLHAGTNLGDCRQAQHQALCMLTGWSRYMPSSASCLLLLGRTQLVIALPPIKSSILVSFQNILDFESSSLPLNLFQTELWFQEQLMSRTHSHTYVCLLSQHMEVGQKTDRRKKNGFNHVWTNKLANLSG